MRTAVLQGLSARKRHLGSGHWACATNFRVSYLVRIISRHTVAEHVVFIRLALRCLLSLLLNTVASLLCHGFVTTELVASPLGSKNRHGHTGRAGCRRVESNGSMYRTHARRRNRYSSASSFSFSFLGVSESRYEDVYTTGNTALCAYKTGGSNGMNKKKNDHRTTWYVISVLFQKMVWLKKKRTD